MRTLHLSAFALGLGLAVAGCGGLIGSLAAVKFGQRFGAGRVVIACRATTAIASALVALRPHGASGWFVFAAGQLILGLGTGAENPNEMGYRQAVTPDRLQGRTARLDDDHAMAA